MPSGAAIIEYAGKHGAIYRVKYADAAGKQVMETVGRASDGWTRQRAERELGKRLDRVQREQWRKPDAETFGSFAQRFLEEYLPGRNHKKGTIVDYKATLRNHLLPAFEDVPLATLAGRPDLLDRYITSKRTLAPKTVRNHLALLHLMFVVARRWRLVTSNPVDEVARPRAEVAETVILSDGEIAGLIVAYRQAEADPPEDTEAAWWAIARRMTVVALGTALRRGELLGLRWGDVELGERPLHVRQQVTRNEVSSPKSRAGRRTVDFGPVTAAALEEQFTTTRYRADSELVFAHPALGTPLDPSKLTRLYVKKALEMAGFDRPGFAPWHGLRHTALTEAAAAGNANAYVQARAGHSQFSVTERYVHAAKTAFPGAADRTEERLFGATA
jgi:integrase